MQVPALRTRKAFPHSVIMVPASMRNISPARRSKRACLQTIPSSLRSPINGLRLASMGPCHAPRRTLHDRNIFIAGPVCPRPPPRTPATQPTWCLEGAPDLGCVHDIHSLPRRPAQGLGGDRHPAPGGWRMAAQAGCPFGLGRSMHTCPRRRSRVA